MGNISRRDYFAGQALAGLLASHTGSQPFPTEDRMRALSFAFADAMLEPGGAQPAEAATDGKWRQDVTIAARILLKCLNTGDHGKRMLSARMVLQRLVNEADGVQVVGSVDESPPIPFDVRLLAALRRTLGSLVYCHAHGRLCPGDAEQVALDIEAARQALAVLGGEDEVLEGDV